MPEGAELRSSRDDLRKLLQGKKIIDLWPTTTGRYKSKPIEGLQQFKEETHPLTIESIDVKGKFMWWTLKNEKTTWYLWCTYGMSGQWTPVHDKHTAFILQYNDSGIKITRDWQTLYFVDPRHFGTIKFISDPKVHQKKLASLGPDVLSDTPMTPELFAERLLGKPNRVISEALMDQSTLSGVGNYMRAEALWLAKVNPWKPVVELTSQQLLDLYESTLSVARNSYESGGATIHTYKGVAGEEGTYSSRFVVYGRQHDADGNEVLREQDSNGRTVHWSPIRQA
jgi:DNA-formamidopyrimidine glycosylase